MEQKIYQTPEEKMQIINSLPQARIAYKHTCPKCGEKLPIPYSIAGCRLTCTCGHKMRLRRLTTTETIKYHLPSIITYAIAIGLGILAGWSIFTLL